VGGVYVAGGIAPKILPRLQESSFMAAFRNKGRMSELMKSIPVKVVLDPAAGLLGAALEACQIAASEDL
jgi:glucokinase